MEPRPSRSFPLAAKLVLGMAVVLAAAAFIASSVISGREWTRLVDAKVHTVEQIAAFAAFLCSPDADQINGADLSIDGGWTSQ